MKNVKKHLCWFICLMLCMSVLSAGIFSAQAAGEPTITVNGSVATLNYGGVSQVNKMYVGYSVTNPGNITTWDDYKTAYPSRAWIGSPADGYQYKLDDMGYYTFLVNYVSGSRQYDAYITVECKNEPAVAPGLPEVALTAGTNKAVLSFGEAYTINKMYYGYIGTTETPYTNYVDYTETAADQVRVTSVVNGEAFELAKVGYYRFIVNYTDSNGKNRDAVYTIKNELGAATPAVAVSGNTAVLDYNGVAAVNKVYVGYFGTVDPGAIADWTAFSEKAATRVCTVEPATGSVFNLKDAGYYVILVNYNNGTKAVDAYYPAYVAEGYVETIVAPEISKVEETNEVAIDFKGLSAVNRVYYGYIGEEATDYVDYYDYIATATDRIVDVVVENGEKYTMVKEGFYRFIVNYNDANGKNRDAVFTIENTVAAPVEGVPTAAIANGVITLSANDAGTVHKVYFGYMGTEDPGEINDWATYTEKRQNNYCVTAPADGYQFATKAAGFYTVVVNYTSNGVNADAYYTLEAIAEPDDGEDEEEYGIPSVAQTSEGANDVKLSANNAYQINKVHYGYFGDEAYDYVDYQGYVDNAISRIVDSAPVDGKVYGLGEAGYYIFIVNYSNPNGKDFDAVYSIYVEVTDEENASNEIYNNVEYILNDMADKEELDKFEFDEKGQEIYDILKASMEKIYALKDEGVLVSRDSVKEVCAEEIANIKAIVKDMNSDEKASFEYEINKLVAAPVNALINIFEINVDGLR